MAEYVDNRIKDLGTTGSESDIASGNYFAIDGGSGTKKLPANLVAKTSALTEEATKRAAEKTERDSELGNNIYPFINLDETLARTISNANGKVLVAKGDMPILKAGRIVTFLVTASSGTWTRLFLLKNGNSQDRTLDYVESGTPKTITLTEDLYSISYYLTGAEGSVDITLEITSMANDFLVTHLQNDSVNVEALDFTEHSVNLFDKDAEDIWQGYYVNADGGKVENEKFLTSGKIYLEKETGYSFYLGKNSATVRFLCEYGENGQILQYLGNVQTFTSSKKCKYIRFSFDITGVMNKNIVSLCKSTDTPVVSEIFYRKIKKENLQIENIGLEQTSFAKQKANLFDKDAKDVIEGYFIQTNGGLQANTALDTTGYIPVKEGTTYSFNKTARFVAAFDESKNSLIQYLSSQTSITTDSGVKYLRLSFNNTSAPLDSVMVVEGTEIPAEYVSYGFKIDPDYLPDDSPESTTKVSDLKEGKSVVSSLVGGIVKVSSDSLTSGESFSASAFPPNLKKGNFASASLKFDTFSKLYFGSAYQTYRSKWLEIDGTNVVLKSYDSAESIVGSVAHGLSIESYLSLSYSIDNAAKMKVVLNTTSGSFTTEFDTDFAIHGTPFLKVEQDSTDIVASFGNKDLHKPIWVFGDSYLGVAHDRWPYYAKENGYWDFLIECLAGQGSSGAYADLQKCLALGCPKILVWCLGMNDAYNTWQVVFDQVKVYCEAQGITLIAATIPSVPDRAKEEIKAYVEASGLRYIDFYSAVGASSSGTWYDGMLSSDNVHPTDLGAKALASRVFVDVPEIMEK